MMSTIACLVCRGPRVIYGPVMRVLMPQGLVDEYWVWLRSQQTDVNCLVICCLDQDWMFVFADKNESDEAAHSTTTERCTEYLCNVDYI